MTRRQCALLLIIVLASSGYAATTQHSSAATAAMQRKIQHIQLNGALAQPGQTPTTFSQQEINDYVASGEVRLPKGVQSVRFSGEPGVVTADAHIDFDELKNGRSSANPLLSVFSGVHDVIVVAHAHGAGHTGYVDIDSVSLDGVEIPKFVLQLFVEKYLQPKYPNVGMTSRFSLPYKIDTAAVGRNQLTVTQK